MALSDLYRKRTKEIASARERLAVERAQESARRIMESDQFKLSALALPESAMAVDAIIKTTVDAILDPVASYTDTLRAKGFRPAEIRQLTHRMYLTHCVKLGETVNEAELLYDNMVKPVADYFQEHQELYNALNPEDLRA